MARIDTRSIKTSTYITINSARTSTPRETKSSKHQKGNDQTNKYEAIREHVAKLKANIKPGQSLRDVLIQELDNNSFPPSPTPNNKTNDVAYMIINRHEVNTAYTDLTGRFRADPVVAMSM